MFMSSLVLLDVFSTTQNKIVWENTSPGSVINCRPIKLEHVQESYEGTREHVNKRLYAFTSYDITSNYKMTLRRGFLYGKNKYVNSFFLTYRRKNKMNFRRSDDLTFFLKKMTKRRAT
jgi:hypothetical protein